jgi:outer membrane protein TolC
LQWPIFNYGRIKNKVRVQDARFQESVVNYQNKVLEAAREVEDAMVGFLRSQEEVRFLEDSVKALKRSVDLSLIQYKEGLVDYQRVIDNQRFLTGQQDVLASVSGAVNLSLVAMYKALGGGWQIRADEDFVPEETMQVMRERTNWGDLLPPKDVPEELDPPPTGQAVPVFHSPDW